MYCQVLDKPACLFIFVHLTCASVISCYILKCIQSMTLSGNMYITKLKARHII